MNLPRKTAALMFAALFLSSSSCMKKPDMKSDDGPAIEPAVVQKALSDTWGNASILEIQKDEFAYTEKSLTIAQLPSRVILQDGKTVQTVEDQPSHRIYQILQQIAEIQEDNQQKLSTSTRNLCIDKQDDGCANAEKSLGQNAGTPAPEVLNIARALVTQDLHQQAGNSPELPLGLETMRSFLYLCVSGEGWNVSCHNLTTTEEQEDAPPMVARQTNCGGLPGCKITKRTIRFDVIVQYKDPKDGSSTSTRARYTIKVAPQLPYLARLTDFCYEGLATYQQQKFPVKVCQNVRNFARPGSP